MELLYAIFMLWLAWLAVRFAWWLFTRNKRYSEREYSYSGGQHPSQYSNSAGGYYYTQQQLQRQQANQMHHGHGRSGR